jgi:hypothetical protein
MNTDILIGTIAGDIIGSYYEFRRNFINIKYIQQS